MMLDSQWGFNELQETNTIKVKDPTKFQIVAGGRHRSLIAKISAGLGDETRDVILTPTNDLGQYIIRDYNRQNLRTLAPFDHIKIGMSVVGAK